MAEENTQNQTQNTQNVVAAPRQFEIAVLPLQNTTLFPETVVPLAVGRERSVKAAEFALSTEEKLICCITTKSPDVTGNDALAADLFEVGTIVNIKRMMRADQVMQLIVQGVERVRVLSWSQEQPFLKAKVEVLPALKIVDNEEVEALKRNIQSLVQQALAMLPNIPPEIRMAVMSQNNPLRFTQNLSTDFYQCFCSFLSRAKTFFCPRI
jgi:ATP-dependent Lon protease